MYKLVLCLRYLRRRVIAYFAVLGMALCVAMMLIVISVMTSFVNKIEQAARGLFGDITLGPVGRSGLPRYDDLIKQIIEKVDRVEAASPRINSYGALRLPGYDYRILVQIAGIRLPEAADVTDFENSLFVQEGVARPTFDPPAESIVRRINEQLALVGEIMARHRDGQADGELPEPTAHLLSRLAIAKNELLISRSNVELAAAEAEALHFLLQAANEVEQAGGDISVLADNVADLRAMLTAEADRSKRNSALWVVEQTLAETIRANDIAILHEQLAGLVMENKAIEDWPHRAILGLGIDGLSFVTDEGETVRVIGPGSHVILFVFPIGKQQSLTGSAPNVQRLTVVDDSMTDVSSIDSNTVYLPFEELQRLNEMAEQISIDGMVTPALCSRIQIKVRSDVTSEEELREISDEIEAVWRDFKSEYATNYPDDYLRILPEDARATTWRENLIDMIGPIESQRTLMIVMFGIMSLVSVVLVFVIFFMIVVQKTRDIGVLKAVGASSTGVAGIFLAYGFVIGLVGSIIGSIGGYFFVRNINPIQNLLDDFLGFRVWSKKSFMFSEIPNEVDPWTVVVITIGAIIAGVLGAIVPAIRAARMQPVEALRYE